MQSSIQQYTDGDVQDIETQTVEQNILQEAIVESDAGQPSTDAAQEFLQELDVDHLTGRCEGRHGLRTSKPTTDADSGLEQYVWRMAYFHAGGETSIPVMARCWLSAYLDDVGIDANVTGRKDAAGEEIVDVLDVVVDIVLLRLGENPAGGTGAWAGIVA